MQYFCVTIQPAVEAYSFMTDGYGIFNVRTTFGYMLYSQRGVRYKQMCTRVDSEGYKNCPTKGSNPGSSDLNCDALTTEPSSLSPRYYY